MQAITRQTQDLVVFDGNNFETNPAIVFLAGKGANSRRVYKSDLDAISNLLGAVDCFSFHWAVLRYAHTQAIRTQLTEIESERTGKRLSAATINRMLCALRGVLRVAWRLGQIDTDHYYRAVDIESVLGETLPAGRGLTPGEITALMRACEADPGPAGVRDAAVVGMLYSGGLRRAEAVALDLVDCEYDEETNKYTIRVMGKRSKERLVFINDGAAEALSDWLTIRGSEAGALFWAINKGDHLVPGRLTSQGIYNILVKRGAEAKVKPFSPHDLRRSCISDLLDAGVDIHTVSKMVGHQSVNTTARYDRRDEKAMQEASKRLHLPYRGRKPGHSTKN
jgi:site-specific recombinase XerD